MRNLIRSFRRWSAPRRRDSAYFAGLAIKRADRYLVELMEATQDKRTTLLDTWTYADFARDGLRSALAFLGE
jgi:hypothetical protein